MAFDYDVVVVGSGFGGSVSALRLSEKGYRVGVIEAGRRWDASSFPSSNWSFRRFVWAPRLGMHGIQRITLLKDVLVLSGAGVGGGSLVYANTLYEPPDAFYADPAWADLADWKVELAPHYAQAKRMLGVVEAPHDTPADVVMRTVAERMGAAPTFRATPVGVYFGSPGETVADPYFGGVGPERTGCIECGGCMIGCRFGAKNSLDHNYLYLAERNGVDIVAERQVTMLMPRSGGYALELARPGRRRVTEVVTAGQVVLSGGVLGTLGILTAAQTTGRLSHLSERVGHLVRTNSEAIVGAVADAKDTDFSRGVAITSSFHADARTHLEPVRYPRGSNAMGLLSTVLVDGGGRLPRQLRFLGTVLRHPGAFLRSLSVRRWSERGFIILAMQTADNSLTVQRRGRRLTSVRDDAKAPPSYLPHANDAARFAAEAMGGGQPQGSIFEALLDVPTTAHIIGGTCMGANPGAGVIDPYHRVFGYPGLHVIDGSAISANLGVNPSLTITAMAERAIGLWPNKGEPDPRPDLAAEYVSLAPVAPRRPVVPPGVPGSLHTAS
jgi:cholesterol oxidase